MLGYSWETANGMTEVKRGKYQSLASVLYLLKSRRSSQFRRRYDRHGRS
jgi:hypothetical protein